MFVKRKQRWHHSATVGKMTCGALADDRVRKEKWVSAGCREGDEFSTLV